MSGTKGVSTYNENGEEILDQTPMQIPLGFKRQLTLAEMVQSIVKSEKLRSEAEGRGYESEQDANDFDVGEEDSYVPYSPYELRALEGETAPPRKPGETRFTEERPSVRKEAENGRGTTGDPRGTQKSQGIDQRVESAIRRAFLRITSEEARDREGSDEGFYRQDEAGLSARPNHTRNRSDTER